MSNSSSSAPRAAGDLVERRRVIETAPELFHDEIGSATDLVVGWHLDDEFVEVGAEATVVELVAQVLRELRVGEDLHLHVMTKPGDNLFGVRLLLSQDEPEVEEVTPFAALVEGPELRRHHLCQNERPDRRDAA